MGLGVLCFTIGGPESVKPLVEIYKKEIAERRAGRRLRERQHHGHDAAALPRGRRARARPRRRPRHGLPPQPACCATSTRSRARRAFPSGRSCCPTRRPSEIDASIASGRHAVRHARRGRGRDPQVRRRRASTRSCSACCRRRWNATSRSRRSRRSASTCCRGSTPTRVHRTTRQREAPRPARRRRVLVPAPTFNLADLWEALCDAGPDAECLVAPPVRHTRGSLDRAANRIANHLVATGVRPGDRVGIYSRNRAEYVEALFGVLEVRRGSRQHQLAVRRRRAALRHRRRRARRDDRRGRVPAGARRARVRPPDPHGRLGRRERRTRLRRRSPLGPTTSTCSTPAAPPACRRA